MVIQYSVDRIIGLGGSEYLLAEITELSGWNTIFSRGIIELGRSE
jgi:hypothetical protein